MSFPTLSFCCLLAVMRTSYREKTDPSHPSLDRRKYIETEERKRNGNPCDSIRIGDAVRYSESRETPSTLVFVFSLFFFFVFLMRLEEEAPARDPIHRDSVRTLRWTGRSEGAISLAGCPHRHWQPTLLGHSSPLDFHVAVFLFPLTCYFQSSIHIRSDTSSLFSRNAEVRLFANKRQESLSIAIPAV